MAKPDFLMTWLSYEDTCLNYLVGGPAAVCHRCRGTLRCQMEGRHRLCHEQVSNVKILKIRTPEKVAVITLKFEHGGFTAE